MLLTGLLSPAIEGLVAAALLAAFMSSADTSLMTATSILTLDIYRKASPASSEEKLMAISRLFVLIIGLLALALAVSMPGIIKTLLIAYTVFTSGLLLPVIAGFYRERLGLTPSGALAALVGGGVTAIFLGQTVSSAWHGGLRSIPIWGKLVGETVCEEQISKNDRYVVI